MPRSNSSAWNTLLQLILSLTTGFLVCSLLETEGLEAIVIVGAISLFCLTKDALASFGIVAGTLLSSAVLSVGFATTLLSRSVSAPTVAITMLLGLAGAVVLIWKTQNPAREQSASFTTVIPATFLFLSLALFIGRFRLIEGLNSRWWLLTHISEDNAAWLNMFGRSVVKTSISVGDIENLGHTLPTLMWILQRFGDLVPGESNVTSSALDASQMAAGVLVIEALLISLSIFLATSIVVHLCQRLVQSRAWLVALLFSAPATVASLLGGLVLARFGYLSAMVALVGIQTMALILIRAEPKNHVLWLCLAAIVTGLSWFPIIPIMFIGLVFLLIHHLRTESSERRLQRYLPVCLMVVTGTVLLLHLQQILSRYPDVDRLQGSMWIGSENLVTFFVILTLAATLFGLTDLPTGFRSQIVCAIGITTGWLGLVWFNDLLRTGGPAHYGTTKLTFVVLYGLLPVLLTITLLGGLRRVAMHSRLLSAFAFATISSVAVTAMANDLNATWPTKSTEADHAQSPVLGILPLIQEAAKGTPSSVICMFVGDFEATGVWGGSYPCTRWGSSLAGVDGPLNESFRQVILGNAAPDTTISALKRSAFFKDIAIVTDKPERLVSLNPWGVISAAKRGGGKIIVFRPEPKTLALSEVVPNP